MHNRPDRSGTGHRRYRPVGAALGHQRLHQLGDPRSGHPPNLAHQCGQVAAKWPRRSDPYSRAACQLTGKPRNCGPRSRPAAVSGKTGPAGGHGDRASAASAVNRPARGRRGRPDVLPVAVLAVIAGAGSFTHIRDTAAQHGQRGPISWTVAVCIDLTCRSPRPPPPCSQQGATPVPHSRCDRRPEVPRGFRTVHPLGWASGKVK